MRVGIVGCGTAGPALGTLLSRSGHEVAILERSPVLRPVGAGILIQPVGIAALDAIGAAEAVAGCAARVDRLHAVNHRGRTVLDLRYRDLAAGAAYEGWGVQRGLLFSVLRDAALAAGVNIRTGVEVCGVRDHESAPVAIASDGTEHGPFDLLVFADGARSATRAGVDVGARVRRYPYGALWFVGEDPGGVFDGCLSQVYRGTGVMLGFLPSGALDPSSPRTTSVFWSIRNDEEPLIRDLGVDRFRTMLTDLEPRAAALVSQLTKQDQLLHASYYDVVLRRPWSGRVAFIGDAGHAMSPQLGLGANLALVDAVTLAESIRRATDIPGALGAFAEARRKSTKFYQFASRWLTPMFQSRAQWLGWPRDAVFGPMCRFGPTKRQMLLSLAGVKTGLFTADPLPQQPRWKASTKSE